jgi:hypothetical protein
MNYQYSSFDCTSTNFEKAALHRFRSLAPFLPNSCQIYRQTWEFSTVICFDFIDRLDGLTIACERSQDLIDTTRKLGLGHAIVFKIGNKVVEWRNLS